MNRRQVAITLIVCAVILASGAYILFFNPASEVATYRQEVAPPVEDAATAPSWVDTGQTPQPDYSSATAESHNATPQPEPEPPANVIEVREDTVVTYTFVESLADFMLHRFQPQSAQGTPATLASVKALSAYYGQELDGFAVTGDDIRMKRKAVLDYAFTPEMVRTLYDLYVPVFMAHLVDTATTDAREYKSGGTLQKRTLTKAETGAMLSLNARRIEQTATVFKAIAADPAIPETAGQYLGAAKAVGRANVQLQNAMADGKDTTKASQRLKQAIMQRERIRKSIVSRLKKACQDCPESDLFHLAQWSYRRVLSEPEKKLPTFAAAAEVLDDLADRFRATAAELE